MMLIKQAFLQFLAIALLASSSNAKALIALEVLMGHPLYGKLFIVSSKKVQILICLQVSASILNFQEKNQTKEHLQA